MSIFWTNALDCSSVDWLICELVLFGRWVLWVAVPCA